LSEQTVDDRTYSKKSMFHDVVFLAGRTTSKQVLAKIGAHKARAIVLLADESSDDPDGQLTLALLSLKQLFDDVGLKQDERPTMVIQAVNHRRHDVMIDAGASHVVCKDDYALAILAQSAVFPEISEVFHQLLDYDVKNCELYVLAWHAMSGKVRSSLVGATFADISQYLLSRRSNLNPVILLGFWKQGAYVLNPRNGKNDVFGRGDGLIVLAYEQPSLEMLLRAPQHA